MIPRTNRLLNAARRTALAALLAGLAAGAALPAAAQAIQNVDPALEAAYDAAFKAMVAKPSDLNLTFRYAEAAIKVGNYEGAISALERMLLINPDLPQVKLELGVLYYRLGSYDVAQRYLVDVAGDGKATDAQKGRAQEFIGLVEAKRQPHQFSGSLLAGLRWQSNANSGPSSASVRLLGRDARLGDEFVEKSDINLFAVGQIIHRYDMGTQAGDQWETRATLSGTRHRDIQRVDVGVFDIETGPRLNFGGFDTVDGVSVRPYASYTLTELDRDRYFHAVALGAAGEVKVDPQLTVVGGAEIEARRHYAQPQRRSAGDQNGTLRRVNLGGSYLIGPATALLGNVEFTDANLATDADSYDRWRLLAGVAQQYADPTGLIGLPWSTRLSVVRRLTDYDAPKRSVDPRTRRDDREWEIQAETGIPLTRDLTALIDLGFEDVDSNLPNYELINWSASVGLLWRF